MQNGTDQYPARLSIDYPEKLNRLTTVFRIVLVLPILLIAALLTATGNETVMSAAGEVTTKSVGGISSGLFIATALMIIVRRKYPKWWFDFARELERFSARIGAYIGLLTDVYPSTDEEQSVHLEIDYPDTEGDLGQWMPLFKWFLAIPHYIVLAFLAVAALFSVLLAWFAILFTGRYPKPLFNFVVGVGRWSLRVQAYAFLLITDAYPPFSLK